MVEVSQILAYIGIGVAAFLALKFRKQIKFICYIMYMFNMLTALSYTSVYFVYSDTHVWKVRRTCSHGGPRNSPGSSA